jgi:hypothetical protein
MCPEGTVGNGVSIPTGLKGVRIVKTLKEALAMKGLCA